MSTKQDFKGFHLDLEGSVGVSLDGYHALWCDKPYYWGLIQTYGLWRAHLGFCKPDVTLALPKEYMV